MTLDVLVILRCGFLLLTPRLCGRRFAAKFGAVISHIYAIPSPRMRAGAARFESRGLPEIFAGVSGKVLGFLGFWKFSINSAGPCSSDCGRAKRRPSRGRPVALSAARYRPERTPMADAIACAHLR